MARIEVQHRWRYYDEARKKWFTTRYHCTEAHIRIERPDATAVEGSRIERELADDPALLSTSHLQGKGHWKS